MRRNMNGAVHWRENPVHWRGIPHKRALFVSDGPDSTSSSSDVVEGHYLGENHKPEYSSPITCNRNVLCIPSACVPDPAGI